MKPKIITRPRFNIVGFKYRGRNEQQEIPQLWLTFGSRFSEFKHKTEKHTAYGIMDNFDEELGEFDYVAGVAVSSAEGQPADAVYWQIPEQTYAVFTCTLPTIHETFDKINTEWLPESGYQRQPGPEFELYDERFDQEDPNSELDIYIPVQDIDED